MPFLVFGIIQIVMVDEMAAMAESALPGDGSIWVYLTGALMIIAALCILFRRYDYWASIGLALILLVYVAVLHAPQAAGNSAMSAISVSNVLKDLGLAGGALIYAGTSKSKQLK